MLNMESSSQLEENYPIHAYLSYRCKYARDRAARDRLKALCSEKNITLRYDESETEEGDSLIEFMEDLTSARCVFLFLSPEYFQSAYTLYELIKINEQADLDKRFIIPLRLSDAMVDKYRTQAKNFWISPQAEADRNKLADLLKEDNHEVLWQRIDAAWETIVKPYLDELHLSLESSKDDELLLGLLVALQEKVKAIIDEAKQQMHNVVCRNVEQILKQQHIPIAQLAEKLKLDSSAGSSETTKQLLDIKMVGEALDVLYDLSIQQEERCLARAEEWRNYLYDIEQIGGWLLLKSVNPVWWFHNQQSLEKTRNHSITDEFTLQHPAYIEVIIARSLLQRAEHSLDEFGSIKAASEKHQEIMLFEAISTEASDYQLLAPIFKDIRRVDQAPQNITRLQDDIAITLRALKGSRDEKQIYYIVPQSYLELLKSRDWFPEFEKKLVGYLQFICCIQESQNQTLDPCQEEQSLLLEKLAKILRLKNKKRTVHDSSPQA